MKGFSAVETVVILFDNLNPRMNSGAVLYL